MKLKPTTELVTVKLKKEAHTQLKIASAILGKDYSDTIIELVKMSNVKINK
jgi:hypothetical protein